MIIKDSFYFSPAGEDRRLHIYLPEGYDRTEERYPVMYFFDGQNLFEDWEATYGTCWGLADYLNRWDKPMICVGIECSKTNRLQEYSPYHIRDAFFGDLHGTGRQTLDWMVKELKPWVDRTFRTYSFREATGIGGSSMGGLMSLYGVLWYNKVFSKAACLSGTVTPCLRELLWDIAHAPLDEDTRVYLSWGELESVGCDEKLDDYFDTYTARCNRSIRFALEEERVNATLYFQRGGGHCEADWRKQLPICMPYLWQNASLG